MADPGFGITLSNNKTEREAINFLLDREPRFYLPSTNQRRAILEHYGLDSKRYIRSFDLIMLERPLKLGSSVTQEDLASSKLVEMKSTKAHLPDNPRGFFFGVTENELSCAREVEVAGGSFRFSFVCLNESSKGFSLLTLEDIEELTASKRIQYQITFKK